MNLNSMKMFSNSSRFKVSRNNNNYTGNFRTYKKSTTTKSNKSSVDSIKKFNNNTIKTTNFDKDSVCPKSNSHNINLNSTKNNPNCNHIDKAAYRLKKNKIK
jgi:hypothetical protein